MPPADDLDRIMAVMAAAFPPEFGDAWTRRQVEDALLLGGCHYALIDAEGNAPAEHAPPVAGDPEQSAAQALRHRRAGRVEAARRNDRG